MLPHRYGQVGDDGQAVVLPQAVYAVPGDAVSAETGVVALEEGRFEPCAVLGEPVHCHHVREVEGGASHAPGIPVDEDDAGGATARIEEIPYMGVAVDDGVGRLQPLRRVQNAWKAAHVSTIRSHASVLGGRGESVITMCVSERSSSRT